MIRESTVYAEDVLSALDSAVGTERLCNASVLVTGATGTIGSFLVDALALYNKTRNAGISIYAAGRKLENLERCFDSVKRYGITYVRHDLLEPVAFDFCADFVVHAAGGAYPAAFSETPVETLMGSVAGTHFLLEYAYKARASRFLYVSSGEVYGQGVVTEESYSEDYSGYVNPVSFRSCYPNGKRAAETLCSAFMHEYGLETVIVRPCHTYGPTVTEADNRANAQFFRNVLRGEDIVLKSAGRQVRSYAYVADCASGLLSVLACGAAGEAYNLSNRNAVCSIAEFAETVAKAAGRRVVFENPSESDRQERSPVSRQVLDCSKLESLGWRGKYSVWEGVSRTLGAMLGRQSYE